MISPQRVPGQWWLKPVKVKIVLAKIVFANWLLKTSINQEFANKLLNSVR